MSTLQQTLSAHHIFVEELSDSEDQKIFKIVVRGPNRSIYLELSFASEEDAIAFAYGLLCDEIRYFEELARIAADIERLNEIALRRQHEESLTETDHLIQCILAAINEFLNVYEEILERILDSAMERIIVLNDQLGSPAP